MVDRPRDQTRPARDPAAPAALARELAGREIDARDVLAYLRHHPDFLDEHPEALRLLRPPCREFGEGVVDFQHFLYERQRREIRVGASDG